MPASHQPNPHPSSSQLRGRLAMFATGIAIGCLLVGMMIISRRILITPDSQNSQHNSKTDAFQRSAEEPASNVASKHAESQSRE